MSILPTTGQGRRSIAHQNKTTHKIGPTINPENFTFAQIPTRKARAAIFSADARRPIRHAKKIVKNIASVMGTSFFTSGECPRKFGSNANATVAAIAPAGPANRHDQVAKTAPSITPNASIIIREHRQKFVGIIAGRSVKREDAKMKLPPHVISNIAPLRRIQVDLQRIAIVRQHRPISKQRRILHIQPKIPIKHPHKRPQRMQRLVGGRAFCRNRFRRHPRKNSQQRDANTKSRSRANRERASMRMTSFIIHPCVRPRVRYPHPSQARSDRENNSSIPNLRAAPMSCANTTCDESISAELNTSSISASALGCISR